MELKPIQNRYLKSMGSLTSGIVLMVVLAVASMFGTALPYEKSLRVVYYSGWFRLILLLLAGNLLLCTWQTLTGRVLPALRARFFKAPAFYENGPMRYAVDTARSAEQVEAVLRAHGFRVTRDGEFLCARKGAWGALNAPLAHLGFILVLLGGFASGLVAYHARIRLNEGASTTAMILEGPPEIERPLGFTIKCVKFETSKFPKTNIPARFVTTLEVSDGKKDFTGKIEVNKALKHRGLKFHQSGFGEVPNQFRYRLEVTDTKTSRSVAAVAAIGERTHLKEFDRDLLLSGSMAGTHYSVINGDRVEASGSLGAKVSGNELAAVRFVPDFMMDGGRNVASRSEQLNNPALQVVWSRDGQTGTRQWLFQRPELRGFMHGGTEQTRLELETVDPSPGGNYVFHLAAYDGTSNVLLGRFTLTLGQKIRLSDLGAAPAGSESKSTTGTATTVTPQETPPYTARLMGREPLYYTDLSVSHNPAIPLIYFGSVLTCLAIILALFVRRVTLSVWCRESAGRALVAVAYARDRTTLTAGVEKALAALK